jgi:hypothetical protein
MDYYESRKMANLQNALKRITAIVKPEYQVYATVSNGSIVIQVKDGAAVEWVREYRTGISYSIPKYLLKE